MNKAAYRQLMKHAHRLAMGGHGELAQFLRDAITDAQRYDTACQMKPQQWAEAWHLNKSTGKPFDEIIDDLWPFFQGGKP